MMTALYDRDVNLVAWSDGTHVWEAHGLEWVAEIISDHAWAPGSMGWLGPRTATSLCDQKGRPVLWFGQPPKGTKAPMRPAKPVPPGRPQRPARPAPSARPRFTKAPFGGWSDLTVKEWLEQT